MATTASTNRRGPKLAITESMVPSLFLYPGLLVILALALYPTFYALYISFTSYNLATPQTSRWVGLDNFLYILQDKNFWHSVWVTVQFIVVAVTVEVVFGCAIALVLHSRLRLNLLWRTTMLIPMIVAPVVAASMWKLMFSYEFGVLTYLIGLVGIHSLFIGAPSSALWSVILVDVWQWTPFVTLICLAGLASLPQEPFEAAAVDGASGWQIVWHLTLPMIQPFLVIAMVLRFIGAYKVFDTFQLLTRGGPGVATHVLSIRVNETAFVNLRIGEGAALSLLILVGATVVTKLVVQRLLQASPDEELRLA